MAEPSASGSVSSNRNVMIVLAYLWLLALVPLLVEKDDKEVQWHAKHGIVLMVAEIILWIAFGIVSTMLGMVSSGLGCLIGILWPILWIGIVVLHIVAIVKGVNGGRLIIPGVSEYASKF
jgi:uncharacterized membrane protein